jgi:hypothetical protein
VPYGPYGVGLMSLPTDARRPTPSPLFPVFAGHLTPVGSSDLVRAVRPEQQLTLGVRAGPYGGEALAVALDESHRPLDRPRAPVVRDEINAPAGRAGGVPDRVPDSHRRRSHSPAPAPIHCGRPIFQLCPIVISISHITPMKMRANAIAVALATRPAGCWPSAGTRCVTSGLRGHAAHAQLCVAESLAHENGRRMGVVDEQQ